MGGGYLGGGVADYLALHLCGRQPVIYVYIGYGTSFVRE